MRAQIIFLMFLLFAVGTNAQESFELLISDKFDQCNTSIFETSENYILTSTIGSYLAKDYKTQLYKINKQGEVVLSVKLNPESFAYVILKFFFTENARFTGIGYQKSTIDSAAYFTIIETDNNFSILTEKKFQTCFNTLDYINIEKSKNYYTVVGSGENMQNYLRHIFAYKINSFYDTIVSVVYPEEGATLFPFEIIPFYNGNSKVFTFGLHQQTNTGGQILLLDSLLTRIDIRGIPEGIDLYNDAKYVDEGHYLLTGKKHIPNSHPQDEQLAIMLMDTSDVMQNIQLLGASDTIDYPGLYTNLDFTSPDNIYYAGMKNLILGGFFIPGNSWFFLNKLNNNLEVQWQKFYGGDAYYMLWNMIATQDGGCLMAGTRYDYLTQVNERDIYLIKVDENGLITGTGEEPSQIQAQDAIVYPNPGSSYLKVQSGPQIDGAVFELFDMRGRLVAQEILVSRIIEVNTSSLPGGNYTYRIGLEGRVVGSGKWVKR